MTVKRRPWLWSAGWRAGLGLWWRTAMLALVPTLTSFLRNRYQVSVQDLLVPVVVGALTAAVVTAVFYRWWRRDALAAGVAASLAVLVLASGYDDRLATFYPLVHAITPLSVLGPAEGLLVSLAFMAVILGLAAWAGRLVSLVVVRRNWKARELLAALTIGVSVAFGLQALVVAKDIAVEWPQFFYKPPALPAAATTHEAAGKPDIYYIILDRYASQDVLKQQFGFDNADFIKYLEDNHYYVNPSAHNNYPYTTMSVASTMQADYLTHLTHQFSSSSEQTLVPFNETIRNSPVAAQLQARGYRYDEIGNWYEASNLSELAPPTYQRTGQLTVLGHTFILNNFSKLNLTQSIFSRFLNLLPSIGSFRILHYDNLGDVDLVHYQLNTLRDMANHPTGGRFIFAHILVPHDPYYFNADGSLAADTDSDNIGKPVKQKYLGQVAYINSQMKGILDQINRGSQGQAVVVLQSDEGPYPFQLNDEIFDVNDVDGEVQAGDMRVWPKANLQMKYGNLAAYHIPAADLASDQQGADSVNVFRLIFNTYFGGSLPYLPHCYYAYPNGRDQPLRFADITAQLTDAPEDARCPKP